MTNSFASRFLETTEKTKERSPGYKPEEWLTSGRASKAYPDGNDAAWWLEHGPAMVDSYQAWRERNPWDLWVDPHSGKPAIELKGTVTLPGGARVMGYIDRVFVLPNGELVVCDIKSGARTPESTAQLGVYATMIELLWGRRPRWGTFWMARKGEHTPLADLGKWSPNVLGSMFNQFIAGVNAGIFLPKPSGFCAKCTVAKHCFIMGGSDPKDPLALVDINPAPSF